MVTSKANADIPLPKIKRKGEKENSTQVPVTNNYIDGGNPNWL